MKKNKTGKKIILGILLILVTIGLGTWARYASSIEGDGTVTAAFYDSNAAMADFPSLPAKPGEQTVVSIQIQNYGKEKIPADTVLKCWVEIQTAKNLPLEFRVETASFANYETLKPFQKSKDNEFILHKLIQEKPYKITAIWPADKNDARYAGMVDYARIKVHIEQVTK